jgi:putative DNA methylase
MKTPTQPKPTAAPQERLTADREPPRLLIEEWLPAAAIGVECIRERSTGQQPPDKRMHVWWARRPLCASRAAVLGSLLPADFPRDVFESLLGFGKCSDDLVQTRALMDMGYRVPGGFNCDRAFKANIPPKALDALHAAAKNLWGNDPVVIDPMAGGGSIPLESARMGFTTLANEYNPVACSVLEATVDYPWRFGPELAAKARKWAKVWLERIEKRLAPFYPEHRFEKVHAYIFARTVPCPDTSGNPHTPLVPDWHLLKPKGESGRVVAVPEVDEKRGAWSVMVKPIGRGAGQVTEAPKPTYGDGKGISLFSGGRIDADYIKAMAQQGKMKSRLYAIATKTNRGLEFRPPEQVDLDALEAAQRELARLRPAWEKQNVIPTEVYPEVTADERPRTYGMPRWADMFSSRQLLCFGTLVEELKRLRPDIVGAEGADSGEAVVHLLACGLDKFANWNSVLSSWNAPAATARSVFDRHDFAWKATFCEMAACSAGLGFTWAVENCLAAWAEVATLVSRNDGRPVEITRGSATHVPHLGDGEVTAVIVDPPYDDNVQYSELADFFYVWLKRTQGHRHPEWFSTYLCEHDEEAVVNTARFKHLHEKAKDANAASRANYRQLMTGVFSECHRILRDDGVLTVMFTHKKQEAWEALFASLIRARFTITATWPVKTEGWHSLHQAKKNAAQSTVILVARKRAVGAGVGYWDEAMKQEIRQVARATAARLKSEGLNAVDQLVGSFGPAMHVYSAFDDVRTDTGQPVGVDGAIDEAADAVSQWRIEQLAERGLDGVEAEGKFALLCWDVLGAAEFRFNEAKLLGHAVGMDVEQLVVAGLVSKSGDKIKILSATERRRERALTQKEYEDTLFGREEKAGKRRTKKDVLKVHPNDPNFRTALDACHALAQRYIEAPGGAAAGIGSAKQLARQQNWRADGKEARLMDALVHAAPEAVRHAKLTKAGTEDSKAASTQFPEFRAWHALLKPLFDIDPPDWTPKKPPQAVLFMEDEEAEDTDVEDESDESGEQE